MTFQNYGNDLALNIVDHFIVINDDNGVLKHNPINNFQGTNKSTALPINEMVAATFKIRKPAVLPEGVTLYVYLRVKYTNSEGKQMEPLRKIYRIVGNEAIEPDAADFNRIETALKKSNLY